MQILLSRTQPGPGRTAKQEQEQTSRNHVQAFLSDLSNIVFNRKGWLSYDKQRMLAEYSQDKQNLFP